MKNHITLRTVKRMRQINEHTTHTKQTERRRRMKDIPEHKKQDYSYIVPLIFSGLLCCALIVSAWFIRDGLQSMHMQNRIVSVKGLAELDVEADLAVWTITHTATGNELQAIQPIIEKNSTVIRDYLSENGFLPEEIERGPLETQDLLAQSYRPDGIQNGRYIIKQSITVRTTDFGKLNGALQNQGRLLQQNVNLAEPRPPSYLFTTLNDIKPQMLAEATKNAREAAAEFAEQSDSDVGDIKTASQGVFQILPRDKIGYENESTQRYKTVRVVSTVTFYLK